MKYLAAIHYPDDYDPSDAEDEAMDREMNALNVEMVVAGVRLFVGSLHPAKGCTSPYSPIWIEAMVSRKGK